MMTLAIIYHVDIAIVGAGPAGAWAAYRLARGGAHVTLIDPSHPRVKPCGGGVTARALMLLGGALGDSMPGVVIRSARLRTTDGSSAVVPLPGSPVVSDSASLVVTSRREFDSAIVGAATAAGANLIGSRVSEISRGAGRFRLTTADGAAIDADRIIGADGANSLVRRRVLAPFRRDQLSIATGYYAQGVTSDEIVLEIVSDPPGYLWSFPRPDHLAIGIGAQGDAGETAHALRARTRRWIDETGLAPAARLVPYSWPIPTLGPADLASLVVAGDDWMLVGDAAGLVDPITREGIFFALQSADYAASALLEDAGPAHGYRERLNDEILPELIRAARAKARFFQPRFAQLLVKALATSAAVRDVFVDLVAGSQPYRTLKWRLLKTLEFRLAWKVIAG